MSPPLEVLHEINRCSETVRRYFEAIHQENERLEKENAELRARVNQTSANSSRPPSSSPFSKPKSLREKTGRKPGGQPGHKGNTLRITEKPDIVAEHKVPTCSHCGSDISGTMATGYTARQVVDIQIQRVVTEHRAQVKDCPFCGQQSAAEFPPGVDHYLQYGPIYRAIAVCLNQGNYIPYNRLAQISRDIFGIQVSKGTLVNIVYECGAKLESSMKYIKDQLKNSGVLHVDETGNRVQGKNQWLHTAGNGRFTYVKTHPKRGNVATDEIGILPDFKGTLVHDFWKSYFNYTDCSHALCNAHILRELNGIIENNQQLWAENMKTFLVEIKRNVDNAGGPLLPTQVVAYEARYDEILAQGDQENPIDMNALAKGNTRGRVARSKARNLIDRMKLYQNDILRFMIDPNVPFDNNQAERDIRMSKLHQKISGGFRSDQGTVAFGNIRSYISSASKQGISMFKSIYAALSDHPFFSDKYS